MNLKKPAPILIICTALLSTWVIGHRFILHKGESITPPFLTENTSIPEPPTAAAHSTQPNIRITERVPLSFGALVKGDNDQFIELTPDGSVFASGGITGQSQHSHIGATNLDNFSSNPLYRIQPGRLSFDINSLAEKSTVRVEFIDGDLGTGVNLSNLLIDVGPDTSDGLLPLPATTNNKIEFQATHSISQATVDLAFGGRLTLSDHSTGEINSPMNVNITVDNPQPEWTYCAREWRYCRIPGPAIVRYGAKGKYAFRFVSRYGIKCNNYKFGDPFRGIRKSCEYKLKSTPQPRVLATVYEHINYGGRSWDLSENGKFAITELQHSIGNDIISSIKVAAGYKLTACEHNFTGNCKTFTNNISNLITIGFNDVISSFEVSRAH
ncbi:hypothetical protein AB833_24375 [Chromatiales bacterium (ex Bugula neritina AB1)]|nr:hypothetical protein AB833_24375 [Chromatiales bacterium (ex Bugula neritina AB1)]